MLKTVTTQCKCHGVSGSCSVKTCWKSLADLLTAAERVYRRYTLAVEVSGTDSKHRPLLPVSHTGRTNFSDVDLLFYTQSPDYCHPEPLLGSSGTANRYFITTTTNSNDSKIILLLIIIIIMIFQTHYRQNSHSGIALVCSRTELRWKPAWFQHTIGHHSQLLPVNTAEIGCLHYPSHRAD